MNTIAQFENSASRSRSKHEGEPSPLLCDRLSRTRECMGSINDRWKRFYLVRMARERILGIALDPIRKEDKGVLDAIRIRDEAIRREILNRPGCSPCDPPPVDPIYFKTFEPYEARKKAVPDPTTLIIVDEADRLQMNSLEQLRSIFDEGKAGMVLIGMPGIEKRIARFAQFYSRIGFVHEFRVLDSVEMQKLLEQRWTPVGVTLPNEPLAPEVISKLIRMTRGQLSTTDPDPNPDRTRARCKPNAHCLT